MKRTVSLAITVLVILSFLAACAQAAPTVAPAKSSAPASATTAPAPALTTAPAVAPAAATTPAVATKPAAAAPTAALAAKIKRGGTLRTSNSADWETADMHLDLWTNTDKTAHHEAMFSIELNEKTKSFEVTPELAQSWEWSDPKTIILKLQKGVKFHDGSDWKAEVAKWNLERLMLHPKSVGKPNVKAIASVEVVDDHTIKLNLKAPSASTIWMLTLAASARVLMMSKEAFDKNGEQYLASNMVGTGAFQLVEWQRGYQQTFKKFPNYWRKGSDGQPLPYLDGLQIRWIPDSSVQMVEFRSGNLELLQGVQPRDVPTVRANPDVILREQPTGSTRMMGLNKKEGPFSENLKLRQAAQYAIDRESMAKTLGLGVGRPPKYIIAAGQVGYSESIPRYEYDFEKAKQLVREAGHPSGVDFTLLVIARQPDLPQSEVIKSMLDKVGLRTTLENIERVAWQAKLDTGKFGATTYSITSLVDSYVTMDNRFHSNGLGNHARISNPAVDACLDQSESAPTEEKRGEILQQCYRLVHDDAHFVHLWLLPAFDVHPKRLHGWKPYNNIINFWHELWLE